MGRDPGRARFNEDPQSGRMGFRHEWEPTDERPLLIYTEAFWASPEEEARWTRAVRLCPLSEYGHLDLFQYLAEVGKVAETLQPQ